MVKWLRDNIGLTLGLMSLISALGGALITGTYRVATWDNRVKVMEATNAAILQELQNHQAALDGVNERRVALANNLGVIGQRLSVLEDRTKFLGDFLHDNLMMAQRPPQVKR